MGGLRLRTPPQTLGTDRCVGQTEVGGGQEEPVPLPGKWFPAQTCTHMPHAASPSRQGEDAAWAWEQLGRPSSRPGHLADREPPSLFSYSVDKRDC